MYEKDFFPFQSSTSQVSSHPQQQELPKLVFKRPRRPRGPQQPKKAPPAWAGPQFPWTNLDGDFLRRIITKIGELMIVEPGHVKWRPDIQENYPQYRPGRVPVPYTEVPSLSIRDAAGTQHVFNREEIRFMWLQRRFAHNLQYFGPGQKQKELYQEIQPSIVHRVKPQDGRRGPAANKLLNPLAWKYHPIRQPCYVNVIQYADPLSIVQLCAHNWMRYKGDSEAELEWQKIDAQVRADLMTTNLKPNMVVRVMSRDLGSLSPKGTFDRRAMPTAYGFQRYVGDDFHVYDQGWVEVKEAPPRQLPFRDGRKVRGRRAKANPPVTQVTPVAAARAYSKTVRRNYAIQTPQQFADQLWRTIDAESFYPTGYQPDPRLAPQFYAVDSLKLGRHPWLAELVRLYELEMAKEL